MSAAAARNEYSYEDSSVAIAPQPTRPSSRVSSRRDGFAPVASRSSIHGSAVRAPRELDEPIIQPSRREPLRSPLRDVAIGAEAARELYPEEIRREVSQRVARNRTRRAHRPVTLSLTTVLFGGAILAQLLGLLYVKSLATDAAHRSIELGDESRGEIGKTNEAIAQTQGKIARMSSPSQIEHWANASKWHVASPAQFDDLTSFMAKDVDTSKDVSTQGARVASAETASADKSSEVVANER